MTLPTSPNNVQNNEPLPLNIWPVAQVTAQHQRVGRYIPECAEHPGKMLPSLARRIVEEFSKPGELVVDPMAGIGTTVVEGALVGRNCIGVELEAKWVDIARRNVAHMLPQDIDVQAEVRQGDALSLRSAFGSRHGTVDLIATSPPYGCEVATVSTNARSGHVTRDRHSTNYSANKSNLGHARGDRYDEAMTAVYRSCFDVLRPGGLLVTVTKNMHRKGRLLNIALATVNAAEAAGFETMEHIVALLCAIRGDGLVARPSFFQQRCVRAARLKGIPQYLVSHEDVLVFRKPASTATAPIQEDCGVRVATERF